MERDEDYTMSYSKMQVNSRGCQCFKDCTCAEDFVPEYRDVWVIKNLKSKRQRITHHYSLEEARARVQQIKNQVR